MLRSRKLPMRSSATKPTEVIAVLSPASKRTKRSFAINVQKRGFDDLMKMKAANGGKLKHGAVELVSRKYALMGEGDNVNPRKLFHRMKRVKNGLPAFYGDCIIPPPVPVPVPTDTNDSELSCSVPDCQVVLPSTVDPSHERNETEVSNNRTVGRPKGSTKKAKAARLNLLNTSITSVTKQYNDLINRFQIKGRRVPNGSFFSISHAVENANGFAEGTILFRTVMSRIRRGRLDGKKTQWISPIHEKEQHICDMCTSLSKIGQPLVGGQIMSLAEEMIVGTKYEKKMLEYKVKRKIKSKRLVNKRWYRGFMSRFKSVLKRGRCRHKDVKRLTWCTLENFSNMYNAVYEHMVEAKVAIKLEEEIMLDEKGVQVFTKEEMVGRPTKYVLTHPDQVLFVDETGCDTNQKSDKNVGGRLYILPTNEMDGGKVGATSEIHFTVLCFSNANGTPVMCAVILKSKKGQKDLPLHYTFGIDIDIRKNMISGKNEAEVIERNCCENGAMAGGPTCYFQGENVPCFVGCSESASITSELLAKMLQTLDSYHLFDRSDGRLPFLLLDGHQSRLQLPFLEYINADQSKWMVCIGVPYGTHIWQVHDASALNGAFKSEMNDAKMEYLKHRNGEFKFLTSDVIPLVKMSWDASFGRSDRAKRAIGARGWNPLNYCLLDHPSLFKDEQLVTATASNNDSGLVENNNTATSLATAIPVDLDPEKSPLLTSFADALVKATLKSEASRKRYEKNQKQQEEDKATYKNVVGNTRVSSGTLAASNEYCVSRREVLMLVRKKQDDVDEKNKEVKGKQLASKRKQNELYMISYNKYITGNKKNLLAKDYVALLKGVQRKGDSKITGLKLDALKRVFERRKHRLSNTHLPHNDIDDDSESLDNQIENDRFGQTDDAGVLVCATSGTSTNTSDGTCVATSISTDRGTETSNTSTASTSSNGTSTGFVDQMGSDSVLNLVVQSLCSLSDFTTVTRIEI